MWNNDYPILYRIDDRNVLWLKTKLSGVASIGALNCSKIISIDCNTIVYKDKEEIHHTLNYIVELDIVVVW